MTNIIQSNRLQIQRRLFPGSRFESAFVWPLEPIDSLDSSFAVQEHLQQLIRHNPSDAEALVELPEGVDDNVWQYEHLRQVCLELNRMVVALAPECTRENCPEMKASGWLYLCAAHPQAQACPAIDYIIHTLDGATLLLNNSKHFPSRIAIPEPSLKHFQSIARRLYRVFAHAYFHHQEIYKAFENQTSLYARFLLLSRAYGLVPNKLVSIPEAHCSDENETTIYSQPSASQEASNSTESCIQDDGKETEIASIENGD